jgi:phosphate transport system permease protein
MTDAAMSRGVGADQARASRLQAGIRKRYAKERRFKLYGILAVTVAIGFLLLLLGRIIEQGHTAFYAHEITLPVYMDPARIDRSYPQGTNFELLVAEQELTRLGIQDDAQGARATAMRSLFSSELKFRAAALVRNNPAVVGQTVTIPAPASDEADLYYKGEISKATPADQRRLSDEQIGWLDRMKATGAVRTHFNGALFTNGDSTEPELAGVLGAVVGSALMLLVTAIIAIPIGIGAAVYLEEFSPRNRLSDLIEVNINNLAAVPSIVYGLLGVALFINWMHLPRSSPAGRGSGPGPHGPADHHHRHPFVA